MENGLNSVDQRLAKFRTTNGNQIHQKTGAIPTAKEKYASAIANILDSFTPEMKDNFLEFIKALNDLQEPVKHLEKFTCVAQQLKNNPEASVEIVRITNNNQYHLINFRPIRQSTKKHQSQKLHKSLSIQISVN